jgi:hypothetical protein
MLKINAVKKLTHGVLATLVAALPLTVASQESSSLGAANPCPAWLARHDAQTTETDKGSEWDLTLSPYAYHWHYNPEHRPVFLGALDRLVAGNRFCGLALFRNSFGQPSAYLYMGQRWDGLAGQPKLFAKLSAGLIYGYKGKYQDKIPFNDYGVAPAIIPSLGYSFNRHESAQIMILGTAGVLFAYGHSF